MPKLPAKTIKAVNPLAVNPFRDALQFRARAMAITGDKNRILPLVGLLSCANLSEPLETTHYGILPR